MVGCRVLEFQCPVFGGAGGTPAVPGVNFLPVFVLLGYYYVPTGRGRRGMGILPILDPYRD
jgi:hypothetical protein